MPLSKNTVRAAWIVSCLILISGMAQAADADSNPLCLWFNKPASYSIRTCSEGGAGNYRTLLYTAALIGNGRFGAMIQGGTDRELLRFSDKTMWTGGGSVPDGHMDDRFGTFQALGDLSIDLAGHGKAEYYRRNLDLTDAISTVTYTAGGVAYRREYFASHPDDVVVVRLRRSSGQLFGDSLFYGRPQPRFRLRQEPHHHTGRIRQRAPVRSAGARAT